jgi:cyclic beta-1,2-glucan synthetase
MAADIYAAPGHVGRGGWTWYTGAAGWTQRAGIESILGIRLRGAELHIDPCIPALWPRFTASIRYKSARYDVLVENPNAVGKGVQVAALDGAPLAQRPFFVPLADDGIVHKVHVILG